VTGLELAIVGYLVCGLAMAASLLDLVSGRADHRATNPARRRIVEGIRHEDHRVAAIVIAVVCVMTIVAWPIPLVNGIRRRLRTRSWR